MENHNLVLRLSFKSRNLLVTPVHSIPYEKLVMKMGYELRAMENADQQIFVTKLNRIR